MCECVKGEGEGGVELHLIEVGMNGGGVRV